MKRASLLSLFSAADADERRARAWLATVVLLAAIVFIAVAIASGSARPDLEPMPSGAVGALAQGMTTNASLPLRQDARAHPSGTANQ
jgi:hypothetical protein